MPAYSPSSRNFLAHLGTLASSFLFLAFAQAETLHVTIPAPTSPSTEGFLMGTSSSPKGERISLDSRSLLRNGKPWMPVMGEFHYSRYPESEWKTELLKMKAGGIDIAATYVFWNHHEEVEGHFDWSGRRNLRHFVQLCDEVGLKVAVRCGPWCHGEVRNGGIPDWVIAKGWVLRADTPAYLDKVRLLYGEIAGQLKGLLWKDGGPVISIQLENEYGGLAQHLLTLKGIARDAGLDVPLYTRTGWPLLKSAMPFGEIIPLFGAYAEGFWDRTLNSMPGTYLGAFVFTGLRTDTAIANEQLGPRSPRDEMNAHLYPYLTCELGGGMMNSYHRRIHVDPADLETVALIKIGSGGNLPGYYMYHGGTNPQGQLTTLMEAQDTPMTNWNDMPVKGYDFYAPLGEYGQVRPHYHGLRRLHLFIHDFGSQLATMPAILPELMPKNARDMQTLRWASRSDGTAGFLFVSNHLRGHALPEHKDVVFTIKLPQSELHVPSTPVTIPSDAFFIWPFNLDLGFGMRLIHASAQPVCGIEESGQRIVFFAAQPGINPEFAFPAGLTIETRSGNLIQQDGQQLLLGAKTGHDAIATIRGKEGSVRIVLLNEADSFALWKGKWAGRECVVLSPADSVVFDGGKLKLSAEDPARLHLSVYPAIGSSTTKADERDGVFTTLYSNAIPVLKLKAELFQEQQAKPARSIPLGKCVQPVAEAPKDADFAAAAVWSVKLPKKALGEQRVFLRLHYRGDAIRIMIGDEFITDDYSNGRPLDIGLWRHREQLAKAPLRVLILPLRSDAPIFIPDEARPKSGEIASLDQAELVPLYEQNIEQK